MTAKLAELGDLNGTNVAKIIDPKIDQFSMPFGIDIFRILVDLGSQHGPKLALKSMKNPC